MPKEVYSLQLTFHYSNGTKESFLVTASAEQDNPYPELRQAIQKRITQRWCSLNTAEETVYINMNNVDKVSVKPTLEGSEEESVFPEAQRLTALTRNSKTL